MKLLFCGDMVFTKGTGKNYFLSQGMQSLFDSYDFRCVNFECAMKGTRQIKVGPHIVLDESMCDAIKTAGFDLYCLANNHIMDEGRDGLQRILNYLGTATTGAGLAREEVYRPYILEKDNLRIGIFNIAENQFGTCISQDEDAYGYAWFADPCVEETIHKLRDTCNYVIIMVHAGQEGWDFPLPEIRETYKRFVDWGADVVIGNHPHRAQGWEVYRNKYIYYSLGNFIFYEGADTDVNRHALSVSIEISEDGLVCSPIWSCFNNEGVVEICNDQQFIDRIYECNELLKDEDRYIQCVNSKALEMYDSIRSYYSQITGIYDRVSIKNIIKTFIKRYVWGERFNDLWLYHNLMIETNYWLTRRIIYLRSINKENES